MTIPYALRLLRYDRWANRRILGALLTHHDLHRNDPMAILFSHLLQAQETWFHRVEGRPLPRQDFWPHLDPSRWNDLLEAHNEAWVSWLQRPACSLDDRVSYSNSKGIPYATSLRDIVQHLVIHGQHHRAQIAALLRSVGQAPPATDYIYFTRDDGERDASS